jgi:hypothetical protein
MIKKSVAAVFLLAVTAVGAMAFAPPASAGSERDGGEGTFLRGAGVLDAHGNGLIAVKGRIDLAATADGGVLLVKDEAGDAVVRVRGDGGTISWRGFTVYFGLDGEATVTGSQVGVIVVGEDIRLHAAGRGWAFLKGRGEFFVNGRGPFPWSPEGSFAGVAPEQEGQPAP